MAGSQRTDAWKAGKRRGYRRWLCRVFLPDGFGAEDECDEFAGGGFAAIGFGGVVGGAVDFGGEVVNGDGQAYAFLTLKSGRSSPRKATSDSLAPVLHRSSWQAATSWPYFSWTKSKSSALQRVRNFSLIRAPLWGISHLGDGGSSLLAGRRHART